MDLQFFAVREFSGEISNQIYQQIRWVKLEDLTGYEFLAADRGLIKDLAAGKLLYPERHSPRPHKISKTSGKAGTFRHSAK